MRAAATLTLAEAAALLDPPITEHQLTMIVRALKWKPDAYRHTGHPGHPYAAYDAAKIMRLYRALLPFLQ
jgi:hypothetical protein